jgi:hypothetical protein
MTFTLTQKHCSLPVLGGSDVTSDWLAGRSSFEGSVSRSSENAVSAKSCVGRSLMLSATGCSRVGCVTSAFLQVYVRGFNSISSINHIQSVYE